MKQRFLNQKLGKRVSRKTRLQKARISVPRRPDSPSGAALQFPHKRREP